MQAALKGVGRLVVQHLVPETLPRENCACRKKTARGTAARPRALAAPTRWKRYRVSPVPHNTAVSCLDPLECCEAPKGNYDRQGSRCCTPPLEPIYGGRPLLGVNRIKVAPNAVSPASAIARIARSGSSLGPAARPKCNWNIKDCCCSVPRIPAPPHIADDHYPIEFEFTMATIGLFDQLPAWNEATVGSLEERKAKLGDPARRPALKADMERPPTVMPGVRGREDGEAGQISMFKWEATFIDEVHLPKNQKLKGRSIAAVAKEQGKHPIDVMLDISVEEDLKAEFAMADFINNDEEALAQIIEHPLTLLGASDGGAHTKFLTLGRYPTHFLAHWVRDKQVMTLEEAHWRLSTMVGWAIGIRDRGFIREGMPADIVVYDLEKLAVKPMETVHDLPDGDWRRVQRANGYRYTIVNGEVTFEDGVCSGALPGKVLRSYDQVPG